MRKRFTHRLTKREQAAIDTLYGPVKTVDGGGTFAAYSEHSYLDTIVNPATIKADFKLAATSEPQDESNGPLLGDI